MIRWNHYICEKCGGITVARHDDEGVTPFMLRCRVKDIPGARGTLMHGCEGFAESAFFNCSQDDAQCPHVIFYRPADAMVAVEAINREPKKQRAWLLEHYQKGGALMREALSGWGGGEGVSTWL